MEKCKIYAASKKAYPISCYKQKTMGKEKENRRYFDDDL